MSSTTHPRTGAVSQDSDRAATEELHREAYMRPAVVVNERVFKWWDYPLFTLLTGINLGVVIYFFVYWFSFGDWFYQPFLFGVLTISVLFNIFMYQLRWLTLPFMRKPQPMSARPGWRVAVVTTFVPGAESLEMLEETVKALVAIRYPHDTWVLDEGDDRQVKKLCLRLGARHFSRKKLSQFQTTYGTFQVSTKHGNYNAWLYKIGFQRYEIISAFDPDHVPRDDFLDNVLGYFEDPEIGYVQAAQVYYNQKASFIARGAAEETYAYYSSIQMVSYKLGYPIVTGCHNTHRVAALRQVGGFASHEADDLLITILYRVAGWKGVYLPMVLAKGLTPVDWRGYLSQQRRWARSVLDIKFRVYPKLASRLPLAERIVSFLHGLYYLMGISTAFQVLLLIFMLITGETPVVISLLIVPILVALFLVFQCCELYRQRFFLEPRREWGFHWRAGVLRFAKWPYILLAVFDALRHYTGPYTITPKVKIPVKRSTLVVPHALIAGLVGGASVVSLAVGREVNLLLYAASIALILFSVAVIMSSYLAFPPPYETFLLNQEVQTEAVDHRAGVEHARKR